jgi:hypothetical protein
MVNDSILVKLALADAHLQLEELVRPDWIAATKT